MKWVLKNVNDMATYLAHSVRLHPRVRAARRAQRLAAAGPPPPPRTRGGGRGEDERDGGVGITGARVTRACVIDARDDARDDAHQCIDARVRRRRRDPRRRHARAGERHDALQLPVTRPHPCPCMLRTAPPPQVVKNKAEWDQQVAKVGSKGLIMFGHYSKQTPSGKVDGVLYTCAELFDNLRRAYEAYGSSVLFVLDGKQKVSD